MTAKRQSPWLILSAMLVYIFLYAPIVVLVVFSFNASRTNVLFEGVVNQGPCGPFFWYCELFQNKDVMNATRNTLIIAFTSTIASTIIGTMAALALQRHEFRGKNTSETALYFPIVTPEIVMGIGILVLFSAAFGWINNTLALPVDQRLTMGMGTVIVSHIAFSIPFVTLVVRARLHGFDNRLEEAAMDLGANEFTTFRKVTFPLIAPGILAGAMLAFTLSLDDFIITFFTTGPGATTLPIYVYGLLRRIVTPEVNALSTIWILVVLVVVGISQWFQSRE
ncbi:MAG: ABC transporter permease [Caldilineaceae bacterium]|nr:ABC transporter permease [Caldilineaceae bacterium]